MKLVHLRELDIDVDDNSEIYSCIVAIEDWYTVCQYCMFFKLIIRDQGQIDECVMIILI